MAEPSARSPGGDLFRKESLEHVSSPEQLYLYIRVNNPKMWMILLALLFLVSAGVFWALTAVIPVTVSVKAWQTGPDRYICYLSPDSGAALEPGMTVRIGKRQGSVVSVAAPQSYAEAARSLKEDFRLAGDYAAYAMGLGDWNVAVTLSVTGGEAPGIFEQAVITSARLRPLDFLSGN
jgi:hypothetical protein